MNEMKAFCKTVWAYYKTQGRTLPWRLTRDPYHILVSEIMLQQTQVSRVEEKYPLFLQHFPTIESLARAPRPKLLQVWKGLGYNRRALNLQRAAQIIVADHHGKIPPDYKTLISLPGIGPATAGDILAFTWNIPAVVIETNIRSVFIHHFFKDRSDVHDKEILPLIEASLTSRKNKTNPREWYFALMDYGATLKKTLGNASRNSVHYAKQSTFHGSNRHLRSYILTLITETPLTTRSLTQKIIQTWKHSTPSLKEKIIKNCNDFEKEGFIQKRRQTWYIHGS